MVRSRETRYSLRNCDDDFLAGRWGILADGHSAKSQADRIGLPLGHSREGLGRRFRL
jgi:hypothetical protein